MPQLRGFSRKRRAGFPKFRFRRRSRAETIQRIVFGSLLEQGRFGPENFAISSLNDPNALTNLRSAITTSVSIFDGRRTTARIDQARESKSQADLRSPADRTEREI